MKMEPFSEPVCDFCTHPEIVETFEAPSITVLGMDGEDIVDGLVWDEEWGACSECAPLIRARDMEGLIHRVRISEAFLCPGAPADFAEMLRVPYSAIFESLDRKMAMSN